MGFGSIAAVQVSYLALGLTLDLFPSKNVMPQVQASTRASVIGRYRFARSPLIAIYSATSGAGEGRSRLRARQVVGIATTTGEGLQVGRDVKRPDIITPEHHEERRQPRGCGDSSKCHRNNRRKS